MSRIRAVVGNLQHDRVWWRIGPDPESFEKCAAGGCGSAADGLLLVLAMVGAFNGEIELPLCTYHGWEWRWNEHPVPESVPA